MYKVLLSVIDSITTVDLNFIKNAFDKQALAAVENVHNGLQFREDTKIRANKVFTSTAPY